MNIIINDSVFEIFPKLTTERLLLEEIEYSDAQDLFLIRSDNRVIKFLDRERHKSIDDTKAMITKIKESYRKREGINWVIKNRSTLQVIGYIGYWRLFRERVRGEIGFALKPDFWNKGIMTEALIKVIDFGFSKIGFHSIEGNVNPQNISSITLLEKIGFKKEAYFREDYLFDGEFKDSVIFSLLETDDYMNKSI
jgi:ribosomal-protein-alanine N-acetyltransferase